MPNITKVGGKDAAALAACYQQLHEHTIAPAAWREQARAFLAQGDLDRCRLLLEALLHAAPTDIPAHLMLGKVAMHSEPDEAVAACRHAHTLANDKGVMVRAQTACALGAALATKARGASMSPEHRAELREEATNVMLPCVQSCPDPHLSATLGYNLAATAAELGLLAPALKHAHAALQAAQKLPPAGAGEESLVASCVLLVAVLLTARQQLASALGVLAVLEQDDNKMSPQQQVLAARIQAGALAAQGDTAAAVAVLTHCRKALTNPDVEVAVTAQVWQELAHTCAKAGMVPDACYCAEQALQVEPWSAASHSAAGSAHEAAGRYLNALESYSAALALDPHHARALLRHGALLAKAGTLTQLSAARDLLSEGLRVDPSNAAGWYQLGQACKAMQHTTAAEAHLRTAMLLAASAPVVPYSDLPLAYPEQAKE